MCVSGVEERLSSPRCIDAHLWFAFERFDGQLRRPSRLHHPWALAKGRGARDARLEEHALSRVGSARRSLCCHPAQVIARRTENTPYCRNPKPTAGYLREHPGECSSASHGHPLVLLRRTTQPAHALLLALAGGLLGMYPVSRLAQTLPNSQIY